MKIALASVFVRCQSSASLSHRFWFRFGLTYSLAEQQKSLKTRGFLYVFGMFDILHMCLQIDPKSIRKSFRKRPQIVGKSVENRLKTNPRIAIAFDVDFLASGLGFCFHFGCQNRPKIDRAWLAGGLGGHLGLCSSPREPPMVQLGPPGPPQASILGPKTSPRGLL